MTKADLEESNTAKAELQVLIYLRCCAVIVLSIVHLCDDSADVAFISAVMRSQGRGIVFSAPLCCHLPSFRSSLVLACQLRDLLYSAICCWHPVVPGQSR